MNEVDEVFDREFLPVAAALKHHELFVIELAAQLRLERREQVDDIHRREPEVADEPAVAFDRRFHPPVLDDLLHDADDHRGDVVFAWCHVPTLLPTDGTPATAATHNRSDVLLISTSRASSGCDARRTRSASRIFVVSRSQRRTFFHGPRSE